MGRFGITEILIIAVVLLVLFGRGKVSSLMGEIGKGITAFKRGVKDGTEEIESAAAQSARDVTPPPAPVPPVAEPEKTKV